MCLSIVTNNSRVLIWKWDKKSLPKFTTGVKTWNTGRDSYGGHLEFRGIFGLDFLLVLIVYKNSLMSSKEQQQLMWKVNFPKMFIPKKKFVPCNSYAGGDEN